MQGWIQAKGGQSCYPDLYHDSSPVSGKELQPLLLRKEQFYFFFPICKWCAGIQESQLSFGAGRCGVFLAARPLGILEVLGGELFWSSGMGLGLCIRGKKGKWCIATGDKKTNAFFVLVTCLDTVELQA